METSFFNINRNKYLKEFMIENPPTFKISNKCCDLAKKHTSHGYADVEDLMVIGIRKAEGGGANKVQLMHFINGFRKNL